MDFKDAKLVTGHIAYVNCMLLRVLGILGRNLK
jgi:hypothetical protein